MSEALTATPVTCPICDSETILGAVSCEKCGERIDITEETDLSMSTLYPTQKSSLGTPTRVLLGSLLALIILLLLAVIPLPPDFWSDYWLW